jgi:hypothetical protein
MSCKVMVLPSQDVNKIGVIRIPDDFDEHTAFRNAVALVSAVQEENPDWNWDDISAELEENGFEPVEFIIGPELD